MPAATTLSPTSRPHRAPLWLWPNLLSLDAPLVAVVWLWFFGANEGLHFEPVLYLAVFGVVWCVYVGDRLADVWRTHARRREDAAAEGGAVTRRMAFYRRYWAPFLVALVLAAAAVIVVVLFRIPEKIMWYGVRGSVLVLVYFWQNIARANRWAGGVLAAVLVAVLASFVWGLDLPPVIGSILKYGYLALCVVAVILTVRGHRGQALTLVPKEMLCGLTFAVGVTLPVYAYTTDYPQEFFASADVLLFAALCTLNCLAISIREQAEDRIDDPAALPQRFAALGGVFPFLAAALAGVAVMESAEIRSSNLVLPAIALSSLLLLVLWLFRSRIPADAYRVLADVALLVPLFFAPFLGGEP